MFEKGRNKVIEISQERIIWEKCFREEICVKIPFDGKKCLKAEACIRILESGGRFYIELQLFGGKVRYELANACFPAYTIGIARLEVCANVGKDSVCLGAKLCIGGKIDGIDLGKCWKIYEGCIKFISTADLMASDGKSVRLDGTPAETPTGPLVWGEPGTNGQHAFFQLLHQGTDIIPVEFLVAAEAHEAELSEHHDLLLANCLAQSEALLKGRTLEEARTQLAAKGVSGEEIDRIAPHRVFPGNRPSLTILYRMLDAYTLGRLLALYEHRVFVESVLYGINAFDQWGVELGKELATGLLPVVQGREDAGGRDGSTAGLVAHLAQLRYGE